MRVSPTFSVLLLAKTLIMAATAVAQGQPSVDVKATSKARIVEVALPGTVLGVSAAGDRLAILTAPDPEAPRAVHLLDPRGDAELTTAVAALPAPTHAIATLPSGEVIIGEPDALSSLGREARGPVQTVLEAPHLDLFVLRHLDLLLPSGIHQPLVGSLRVFAPGDDGGWSTVDDIALPKEVRRERRGLRLESPPVTVLERDDKASLVLAGPVPRGSTRLLTTWIDAETRRCEGEACETRRQRWVQLPGPEEVTESWYVDVDGRATLVVATVGSEKVGVFERKNLRVFPLWSDRTRAGAAATLRAETTSRRWQEVEVAIVDLDGNDRDDLAVLQRDGLGGKKVVVEVYSGTGNGGFYRTSRKTEVSAPEGLWRYGHQVTGDPLPDLVTLSEGRLAVFSGVDHKRLVVEKKPDWTFEAPEDRGGLSFRLLGPRAAAAGGSETDRLGGFELVDLGGDHRQIVVWVTAEGRTWLRLIELS